ncbi:hypothetical protein HBH53_176480 [Parastagonospora nodorum]|nr:hypothetical protein HBH53_176480 [Parastagonospora nodorum]KAH3970325.1 hypothetical protein HBH52_168190 [Parastagonospora nodorum]KAH3972147.1 hypothetical protein HBH51_105020 [Parastagonospora nodorum]KAH3996647.1 hypothetical protein HBI10_150690 [Parastagonospora nodorum]KAH4009159.1 hypothetical protein HBI13_224760 [Parastagonospora nodorum]
MALLRTLISAGKRVWRGSEQSASARSSRALSITCRGKSISRDELFAYTNGRFLVNETHACDRRFVRFDVDQLCSVAASAGGPLSPIQAIEKLEGGFSKALLMRKEDEREIVAKIPFPIAGPPKYTTASEVAVLYYLQAHTSIPVPRVLAWSSDPSNPVGAEYIIMEKASGVQLFNTWGTMSDSDRFELVQHITELEGELASICFPASGSLYLRESLAKDEAQFELSRDADPSQKFCIGPSCERQWNSQSEEDTTIVPSTNFDRGPWLNISSLGDALVKREVGRIREHYSITMPDRPTISTEGQLAVLNMATEVMSRLDTGTIIDRFSQPVLWHTDLHMGNIFVSSEDPTKVVSLIDWQSISVSPLVLQARFPEILSLDPDFVLDSAMPDLPEDYETLDAADKQIAEFKTRQARMAKAYEVASSVHNPQAYKAFFMPSFLQDLFTRCGEASEEGIIPLRACLIQIAEAWDDIGFEGPCPLEFSDEEIQRHSQQFQEYRDFHRIQELAKKLLDTDSEGWISPQLDFTLKVQQNKDLLEELMRRSNEYNKSPEEVRRIWPF